MKKHIYFVPGTAANSRIFDRIKFPGDKFELHYLEWLIPTSIDETIASYAHRVSEKIHHKNPILVGVSFGGIIVQEMSKLITCQKLVIISSIKNKYEFPKNLRTIKKYRFYLLAPTRLISPLEKFLSILFGLKAKKQIEAYRMYLSQRDPLYLKWAIKEALYWKQETTIPGIIHLHGTNDFVFPIQNIKSCIPIENGSHAMILTKGKKISSILLDKLQ